jgi:hypothetical protein
LATKEGVEKDDGRGADKMGQIEIPLPQDKTTKNQKKNAISYSLCKQLEDHRHLQRLSNSYKLLAIPGRFSYASIDVAIEVFNTSSFDSRNESEAKFCTLSL